MQSDCDAAAILDHTVNGAAQFVLVNANSQDIVRVMANRGGDRTSLDSESPHKTFCDWRVCVSIHDNQGCQVSIARWIDVD
jgi:hypothetical protein